MNRLVDGLAVCVVSVIVAGSAYGGTTFQVVVTGEVEFNQISASPLGNVNTGDAITMSFQVDSDLYLDGVSFPTRGYEIDHESFSLTLGSETIGLQDPFPLTETPYFVLRNNDPGVDGFFLGSHPDVGFPNGIPINQPGIFSQLRMVYATTYPGDSLESLDIADSGGMYDFTGLSVFSMRISDGPAEAAMGMVFEQMTIMSMSFSGDFNGDLVVDASDYTVWRDNLGAADESALGGNGSRSGGVDIADYTLWKNNFGTSGSAALRGTAVPEPASAVMFCAALVLVGLSHRDASNSRSRS
ncbi:MAG: hypothetical protein ACR2NU_07940 [Aeoliella sp.]